MTQSPPVWSDNDFKQMEIELGVPVPRDYREFVTQRAPELTEFTYPLTYLDHPEANKEERLFEYDVFHFKPSFVTSRNLDMRGPNSMVGYAFPNWWKEYFIAATDGGSGMYALRLDGDPTLWHMQCDGGRIERAYDSLDDYADEQIQRYQHNLPLYRAKREWFNAVQRGEMTRDAFQQKAAELDFRY